nr:N-acetylglucosamine/diacetylchitobiose ABC transporter substrate-binding protein [Actinoplanes digitatis]
MTAGVAAPLLSACVTGGGDDADPAAGNTGAKSADNPLGVKTGAPLEVVIFKGGYGDEYAKRAEAVYAQKYAAKVDHQGIQKIGEALQPRFVANTPPDVVDNTGASRLDIATLVSAKQVGDLGQLLDAPALDQPGKTVRDTLLPGVVDDGTFDKVPLTLNLTYTVWGLWYSKPLFAAKGWAFPKTWDEMLALCASIKAAGIAPWTYQGKYPEYINDPLLSMAAKTGGLALIQAVDNLEPNAWKAPGLIGAAEAFAELARQGIHHVRLRGAVAHRGAGGLVAGEGGDHPVRLVAGERAAGRHAAELRHGDGAGAVADRRRRAEADRGAGGQQRVVPGAEPRRRTQPAAWSTCGSCSRSSRRRRSPSRRARCPRWLSATEGLTLSSGLGSVRDAVAAASRQTFTYRFRTWYAPLAKAVDDATGELVNRRVTAAQWSDRIQKAADALAGDTSVTKYTR